jgi:hypothetical protein
LAGDLRFDDLVLRSGDFQCVPAGTVHSASHTEGGCLLVVIAGKNEEILA